jgi:hypothetical protein
LRQRFICALYSQRLWGDFCAQPKAPKLVTAMALGMRASGSKTADAGERETRMRRDSDACLLSLCRAMGNGKSFVGSTQA